MSVVVLRNTVDDTRSRELDKILYVVPKMDKHIQKKFYGNDNGPKGVSVYRTAEINDIIYLYLPFSFACNFIGKSNDSLIHAPISMKFTGVIRDGQKPFVNKAVEMLNRKRTTILNLPPGFGKTTMSCGLSCMIGLLTIVLIHDSTLYEQWAKTYKDRSTAITWMVGEEPAPPTVDVIICLWTRTQKIPKELRDYVGILIIDEAHQFCNKSGVDSILDFSPKYIIAATATFEKRNDMHMVMEAFVGNEKITTDFKVPFLVYKYETGIKGDREKKNGTTDWPKLNKSFLYNPIRNKMVVDITIDMLKVGRKILIFSNEVEHVILIHQMLKDAGIESCDYLIGGKTMYKNSRVLVGNTQKCATGFDEEMFCDDFNPEEDDRIDTIIFASSFKDLALRFQACGRAMRAKVMPWVIHMVDDDQTIQSHYKESEWWYRRNCGTIMIKSKQGWIEN